MRICYVNHSRFPTEKAHGFQIAQVCDALRELGHEVSVLSPSFQNAITAAPEQYYGLRHPLHVEQISHFDAFRSSVVPGFLGFAVSMRSYGRALQDRLKNTSFDIAYVRSTLLVPFLLRTLIPVVLELHELPRFARRRFVHACNRCTLVVCLTSPMRAQLLEWGIHPDRVIVEADGVDLRRFENLPESAQAKSRWKLPVDRTIIGYVGALATREFLEKGVRELIDAIVILKRSGEVSPLCWIVGGPDKWVKTYQEHARARGLMEEHVRFQGRIDPAAVPSAIAACDVCVYPAPKTDHPYFMRDTSPLKLFEYLAAGRPVVCADIPSLRDVVDERSVFLCAPGDPDSIASAIKEILNHPEVSERVRQGKRIAQEHSWEKRMQRILLHLPLS